MRVNRGLIVRAALLAVLAQPLASAVPSVTPAAAARAAGSVTAEAAAPKLPVGELPERRTRTSKTSRAADGKLTTTVSARPLNYRDGQGHWQPIDSGLASTKVGGYAYQNRANSFQARFKQTLGDDFLQLV